MPNICARFSPQCTIYAQDLCTIVLFSPMRNICTRFVQDYTFPQCTIYVQDLHKVVLISPMCNICTRFAQDCTALLNVQYTHKIAGIIERIMSHITYLLQDVHKITFHSSMCKMCARSYFFPLFDLFSPTSHVSNGNLFNWFDLSLQWYKFKVNTQQKSNIRTLSFKNFTLKERYF